MHNRILQVRKAAELTQKKFAERIGLTGNFVWMLESGERTPSDRTISDICREFGVNENWLRTGDGDMYVKVPEDAQLSDAMEQIKKSDDDFIKGFIKKYWGLTDEEKAVIRKMSGNGGETSR